MFGFRNVIDPEWWYRKCMIVLGLLLSQERIETLRFHHLVKNVYRLEFGKRLHLRHPKLLNEKLIWLSLFWQNPIKTRCADKFKMRSYCLEKGLPEDVLVPLIGVYNSADEIDISLLPDKFVLKCNHGCAYNIIVNDKSSFDFTKAKAVLNCYLMEDYQGGITELHYRGIFPHLIMCESYLASHLFNTVVDYKIYCVNGIPVFVLVCFDRNNEGVPKYATFDFSWIQVFYSVGEKPITIERPASLDCMLNYSKILSTDFPFVRVDFYDVNGHPYIGELTFTPLGNMLDCFIDNVQVKLGKMLQLPPKYE